MDWNLAKKFSLALILDYNCFPIDKNELSITVAITNPLDVWALKKAEEETRGLKLKLVIEGKVFASNQRKSEPELINELISNIKNSPLLMAEFKKVELGFMEKSGMVRRLTFSKKKQRISNSYAE